MANNIIEAIKLRHIHSLLDKTVAKSDLTSFYHIINTRNMDIKDPEVFSRLIKILEANQGMLFGRDLLIIKRLELDAKTILNTPVLKKIYLSLYQGEFAKKRSVFYSSIIDEEELFLQLIEDESFKGELSEMIDFQEYGEEIFYNPNEVRGVEPENIDLVKNNVAILQKMGFVADKEKLREVMIQSVAAQSSLYRIGLIEQQDIADLYKYKFEKLKEWHKNGSPEPMPKININHFIYVPSPDNPMANYWNKLSEELSMDPMEFVFRQIKDFKGIDIFGEKEIGEAFEEWKQAFTYNTSKKEFYSKLDHNIGRLFTKDGLPTRYLFTNTDYEAHLLHDILYYNWEGRARNNYRSFPEDLIEFFLANKNRVPEEYRFLFDKMEELNGMENYYERQRAMKEFLEFMTDGHHIIKGDRLYDENGFNDRFFHSMLHHEDLLYIDYYCPDWRSHLSKTELLYIEKYKSIFNYYTLDYMNREEGEKYNEAHLNDPDFSWDEFYKKYSSYLDIRLLINKFFNERGLTRQAITLMLGNTNFRAKLFDLTDEVLLLNEEKAYIQFLKEYQNLETINIPTNQISKFFDKNGPKDSLSTLLYEIQEYEILIKSNLNYKNVLKPKEIKIMDEYIKIDDMVLQQVFKNFVKDNQKDISEEKIELISTVLQRISKSNSTEMISLREQLALQLLATDKPLENLDKIERIFLKNNLPTVGKIYSVFSILHPDFNGFDFTSDYSMVSPVLKAKGNRSREMVIFSDLLRATMGSNNRSIIAYLKNIREGNELYKKLKTGQIELTEQDKATINEFIGHLVTLYNNSHKGKSNNIEIKNSGDYVKEIDELMVLLSPNGSVDYNLADRIINMFCHFAGITSLEEAEEYMKQTIAAADRRNRESTHLTLQQGDFVKGIGGISYLGHILQNGSVSKEYLGAYSSSDATPLDTDLSMVLTEGTTIGETIDKTEAKSYGPIWFVLKGDDRFAFTRRSSADPDQSITEKPPISKLETFYTGVCGDGHYGIRTGFASSEINAIVIREYDKRIGLEIAINGFYIPVFDTTGKLVFSPKDYDLLREKMRGLKQLGTEDYIPSDELMIPGIEQIARQIPASIDDVIKKRKAINASIQEALSPLGITIKDHYDGDLTDGVAELIDTGSTGRFTNMPGDGDFDFMLKLDRKIMENPTKLNEVKLALLKAFNKEKTESGEIIGSGDFRLKGVNLPGLDVPVDIDITFETKTDKVAYSTDESLKDRLASIKEKNPKEYILIISNILLAKKLLKKFEAYKPNRGDNPQGGLGGVGVENWILQNGGSLKQAAESFLATAEGKTFEQFRDSYVIWDFGENHLITRKQIYPHDNFTYNMSAEGFEKMKTALRQYLAVIRQHENTAAFDEIAEGMTK